MTVSVGLAVVGHGGGLKSGHGWQSGKHLLFSMLLAYMYPQQQCHED
jgi:hypothetical protein